MQPLHCFSGSYAEARDKFLMLCGHSSALRQTYVLPEWRGRQGELLAMDVGWFGPVDARAVILITSGTHGVEGFAGSACQIDLAQRLRLETPSADIAFMLVHAINPYGFSHLTRVNEDNVDLNRNFQDFTAPLPSAKGYPPLHEALTISDWRGPVREKADARLAAAWHDLGERGFQQAVCEGQHDYPDGLFYGGREPSWSNRTLHRIIASLPESVELLVHLDVHTGLGESGHGELVYTLDGAGAGARLAQRWFGHLGLQMIGGADSSTTKVHGTLNHAFLAARPTTLSISIEYGTVDFAAMFGALREEHLFRTLGLSDSPEGLRASQALLECFRPDDEEWRQAVLSRFDEVTERIVACTQDWLENGG